MKKIINYVRRHLLLHNTKHENLLRAAIYIRDRTTDEQISSNTIAEQERSCREFAAQNGWQIVRIYIDDGYSVVYDRPAFQHLKHDATGKQFEVVITHSVDRLVRNPQVMLHLLTEWWAQGIFYASAREKLILRPHWNTLFAKPLLKQSCQMKR